MKINDVTLTIREGMVVWPGEPEVDLHRVKKLEEGANANVTYMGFAVHTGTHVDAPRHFIADGNSVDLLDLNMLIGEVTVVEIPQDVDHISAAVIARSGLAVGTERVLFKTRNSNYWVENRGDFQPGFVGITEDGAQALVELGVKLVGIDYLSIAPYKKSRPTHLVLLREKMVVIEGLDLSKVKPGKYTLYCLPLKLANADGAPARVILIED